MVRRLPRLPIVLFLLLLAGCYHLENPTPPTSETQLLTSPIQLTHGFMRAGEAYFSPDMRWIIFQATTRPDEDYQMYLGQLKYEGGQISGLNTPVRISPTPSWNSCGNFSPDGNSIIFASTALHPIAHETSGGYQREKNNYKWSMPSTAEIFRADNWKGAIAALAPNATVNLARYPLTQNEDYDAECAYSPDGQWIVFARKVGDDPMPPSTPPATMPASTQPATMPNLEIFVMKADGTHQTRLTNIAGYDGGPFFSPDGKRLVYRSDRKGNNLLQVYTADLVFDGQGNITALANEKQLTHDVNVNWGPYWHPDGHHLIWATSIHGHTNYELYLMRDDGSRRTRVTFTPGADVLPVFSPDGKYLMWTTTRGPEKTSQIWVSPFQLPKGS